MPHRPFHATMPNLRALSAVAVFALVIVVVSAADAPVAWASADDATTTPSGGNNPTIEGGLVAGYKDVPIVGLYLLGPQFWHLRPGVEVSARSSDKPPLSDGAVEIRNEPQYFLSLSSRLPVMDFIYWGTKFGGGWYDLYGQQAGDEAGQKRRITLPYFEFEAAIGSWQPGLMYQRDGAWTLTVEAGFSLRQNLRPAKVFTQEDGSRLAQGGTGTFVRIGAGL